MFARGSVDMVYYAFGRNTRKEVNNPEQLFHSSKRE